MGSVRPRRTDDAAPAVTVTQARYEGLVHRVRVQPYILPSQHHFSSPQAHEDAAGPKRWNRSQGLYIYRRDRLIQSGGWSRLRTLDEHSKLARISLDIPPEADGAFRTDVAKMHVGLPEELRPQLRALIAGVVARAQDVYRQPVRLVPAAPTLRRTSRSDFCSVTTGPWSRPCWNESSPIIPSSWTECSSH